MATKAQIAANQSNARHSTGPTTPQGRATVSINALRHGLAAREANLFGEIEEKFFHLDAFSLFQAERSEVFELLLQNGYLMAAHLQVL